MTKSRGPLGLTDAQFWNDPYKTEDAVLDRLIDQEFVGALLDGPSRVDLDRRGTLPLHGVWASTYRDNRSLDFDRQALVVAVRLESGQVFVERAVEQKTQALDPEPPDESPPPEGTTLRSFHVDLRGRLPTLPWRPGTLLVTLLVRDRVSNRVKVELALGGELADDPDVKAFLERHRRHAWPQPVYPPSAGGQVPGYRRQPQTPAAPAAAGIALAFERVNVVPAGREGGSVVVRGCFRLPLLDRFIVRTPDPAPPEPPAAEPEQAAAPSDDEEPQGEPELTEADERALRAQAQREEEERGLGLAFQDPRDRQAKAIVPVTLVVVPADWVEPLVVPLQVPIYDAIDPERPPAEVVGQFAVDLLDFPDAAAVRGRSCFLYAFGGEVMTGPLPISIVRADDLRPR